VISLAYLAMLTTHAIQSVHTGYFLYMMRCIYFSILMVKTNFSFIDFSFLDFQPKSVILHLIYDRK